MILLPLWQNKLLIFNGAQFVKKEQPSTNIYRFNLNNITINHRIKKKKSKKDFIIYCKDFKEWGNGYLKLLPATAPNYIGRCPQNT